MVASPSTRSFFGGRLYGALNVWLSILLDRVEHPPRSLPTPSPLPAHRMLGEGCRLHQRLLLHSFRLFIGILEWIPRNIVHCNGE